MQIVLEKSEKKKLPAGRSITVSFEDLCKQTSELKFYVNNLILIWESVVV